MSYEFEQDERTHSAGVFLTGLLIGAAVGAGLALLYAPKKGDELRGELQESARKARQQATEAYQQASERVSQAVDKGREAYQKARDGVGKAKSEVKEFTGASTT